MSITSFLPSGHHPQQRESVRLPEGIHKVTASLCLQPVCPEPPRNPLSVLTIFYNTKTEGEQGKAILHCNCGLIADGAWSSPLPHLGSAERRPHPSAHLAPEGTAASRSMLYPPTPLKWETCQCHPHHSLCSLCNGGGTSPRDEVVAPAMAPAGVTSSPGRITGSHAFLLAGDPYAAHKQAATEEENNHFPHAPALGCEVVS